MADYKIRNVISFIAPRNFLDPRNYEQVLAGTTIEVVEGSNHFFALLSKVFVSVLYNSKLAEAKRLFLYDEHQRSNITSFEDLRNYLNNRMNCSPENLERFNIPLSRLRVTRKDLEQIFPSTLLDNAKSRKFVRKKINAELEKFEKNLREDIHSIEQLNRRSDWLFRTISDDCRRNLYTKTKEELLNPAKLISSLIEKYSTDLTKIFQRSPIETKIAFRKSLARNLSHLILQERIGRGMLSFSNKTASKPAPQSSEEQKIGTPNI